MASFDLSGGGADPMLRKRPQQQQAIPNVPTFNTRSEDAPGGDYEWPQLPASPAPPQQPTIHPPSHDPWVDGAPTGTPPRDQNDPFNGMFDERLGDAGWANTPEGLAEGNRQNDYLQGRQQQQNGGGGPQGGDYRGWVTNLFAGKTFNQQTLVGMEPILNQYGIKIEPANSQGERHKLRLPDGSVVRVGFGEGVPVWIQQSGPNGASSFGSTNPFDDPATKSYIDQLNARIAQLHQPQQNPEMDSLLTYLKQYFEQLQGPTYTDAQRDVINTQSIDPMERQRTARKQQVIQQMASRGMGPSDGPTIAALQNVDREFDQMRTNAQGNFAVNEINQGRDDRRQAVNVGTAAAQLRSGIFDQQEGREDKALGYARQIPDLAQARIAQAISLLNGNTSSPASLFGALNSAQRTGMDQSSQDSEYWQSIIAAIAKAFGL